MNDRVRFAVLALTASLAGSCGRPHGPVPAPEEGPAVEVRVEQMRPRPFPNEYVASGSVRPRASARLSARVTAHVKQVRVRAGEAVRRGQLLAVLDAGELAAGARAAAAQGESAAAAAAEARAARDAAQAEAELARATARRYRELASKHAATAQEIDEAVARERAAEAALAAALARLERAESAAGAAEAGAEAARALAGYTRLVAPFDGRIGLRAAEPGMLASPGVDLLVVESAGPPEVAAFVSEVHAGRLAPGDPATVELGPGPDLVEGTISEVAPRIDAGSRSFEVRVELPAEAAERAHPGAFARVRFPLGMSERITVPAGAVVARGQLDLVWVADEGRSRLRLVTLGGERQGRRDVLSGLTAGERVIVAPLAELRDGRPVEIAP